MFRRLIVKVFRALYSLYCHLCPIPEIDNLRLTDTFFDNVDDKCCVVITSFTEDNLRYILNRRFAVHMRFLTNTLQQAYERHGFDKQAWETKNEPNLVLPYLYKERRRKFF